MQIEETSIEPLSLAEIPEIEALARDIWREHHANFISEAQIEYMLQGKYTRADLEPYVNATDRWFDVLRVRGTTSGFLRCIHSSPGELKLSEIYLARSQRGKGLGQMLLARTEAMARRLDCRTIVLYVNRRNEAAVGAYLRNGFVVKEEKDFDIGNGFVMDDYLMEKPLVSGVQN